MCIRDRIHGYLIISHFVIIVAIQCLKYRPTGIYDDAVKIAASNLEKDLEKVLGGGLQGDEYAQAAVPEVDSAENYSEIRIGTIGSVFSSQEIDILHFDEFFGKIEPINQ